MNVLFLTLIDYNSLGERDIYTDLLREFVKKGHKVYMISPVERRRGRSTHVIREPNATILKLRIGNTQKTNLIEKGISTLTIEPLFIRGIRSYFSKVKFDLVLYSTPPITFCNAVEYVKKRDGAKTYLLLKDIFPQNAVDMGMMTTEGAKGFLYRFFRQKEQKLYTISDRIGCMSPANVRYLLEHNPEIDPQRVELSPNSVEIIDKSVNAFTREAIRKKYRIPSDKLVFVYGGNLGKPQGIPFLISCLETQKRNSDAFFLIVGDGTEYPLLENFIRVQRPSNVKLMQQLPKEDYDTLVGACDVGLIFLDHRFTIPNFPSRLLSYMQAKLPVIACTDPNSDMGQIITEGNFGWWCESNDAGKFAEIMDSITQQFPEGYGENAFRVLKEKYNAVDAAQNILNFLEKEDAPCPDPTKDAPGA